MANAEDDFEDPLLERRRQKDDEEIIVPELWEIVAPVPVPSLPHSVPVLPSVPSVPPTLSLPADEDHSEPVLPSVLPPLSPLPHTPAPYRQVYGRKRVSEISHSVVGAGLRKKRRRLADVPPSLSQYPADTSISVVAQHFPAKIDKRQIRGSR